jgi:hypothetical protein
MPEKLKKPGTVKGWLGQLKVPGFLTFLPDPKKLPPIAAAHRALMLCERGEL